MEQLITTKAELEEAFKLWHEEVEESPDDFKEGYSGSAETLIGYLEKLRENTKEP